MRIRWLGLLLVICFAWGCTQFAHKEEILYEQGKLQKFSYLNDASGAGANKSTSSGFMDAIRVIREIDEKALPEFGQLPTPSVRPREKPVKPYTGIIKNNTRHDLSVPSHNSDATVIVPARGYVEYTVWSPTFEFTAFRAGDPYHCFRGKVDPKAFQFMCKKYDFMAVIQKEDPPVYKKLKKRVRKRAKRSA
ncbi:MAG: hypothetical protein FJ126_09065 [Deltaproteobacteria bacterium]|nr:hypothetical protein [Deltaproteobacteria bacterium]